MPATVVTGIVGLQQLAGTELPVTPWLSLTQERVDDFAAATGDDQWIHVDRTRAAQGPFQTTLAHGFLTLSLLPYFWRQTVTVEGFAAALNYGLGKVRFPAPVPVPSRLRARFHVAGVADVHNGVQVVVQAHIEREHEVKPVCVAEMIVRYICP
jgi:acyl dehydratase